MARTCYQILWLTLLCAPALCRAANPIDVLTQQCSLLLRIDDFAGAETLGRQELKKHGEQHGLLLCLGQALWQQKRYPEALAVLQRADALAHTPIDKALTAKWLGNTYQQLDQLDNAEQQYQRALALTHAQRDKVGEAAVLHSLAQLLEQKGQSEQALARYQQALRLLDNDAIRVKLWNSIGSLYYQRGDYEQATLYFVQMRSAQQRAGNERGYMRATLALGNAWRARQDYQQAEALLQEGLAAARQQDDSYWEATADAYLSWLERDRGNLTAARDWMQQAAQRFEALGAERELALAKVELAKLAAPAKSSP